MTTWGSCETCRMVPCHELLRWPTRDCCNKRWTWSFLTLSIVYDLIGLSLVRYILSWNDDISNIWSDLILHKRHSGRFCVRYRISTQEINIKIHFTLLRDTVMEQDPRSLYKAIRLLVSVHFLTMNPPYIWPRRLARFAKMSFFWQKNTNTRTICWRCHSQLVKNGLLAWWSFCACLIVHL